MKVVWTWQMDSLLTDLFKNEKNSYREIAKAMEAAFEFPFTKNSCIGRARRIGLPARTAKAFHMGPILPQFPRRKKDEPVAMEQLRYRDCRWPLGRFEDKPPYLFCGKLTVSESCSWCAEHAERAFGRATSGNAKTSLHW